MCVQNNKRRLFVGSDFRYFTFAPVKRGVINTQIYIQRWEVSVSAGTGVFIHTHIQKYAHTDTQCLWKSLFCYPGRWHTADTDPSTRFPLWQVGPTLSSCFSLQELPERRPGSPLSSSLLLSPPLSSLSPPLSSLPLWEYHAASSTRAPGSGPSVTARLTSAGQVSQTGRVRRGGSGSGTSDPDPDLETAPAF